MIDIRRQCIIRLDDKFIKSNNNFTPCFEYTKCSPHISYDNISCLSIEILLDIINYYNDNNDNNKIQLKNKLLDDKNNDLIYKKYLISLLNEKIGNDQLKWANKIKNKKLNENINNSFLPIISTKRFKWLDTNNINDLLHRYELKYIDYKSYGALPSDFQIFNNIELSNIDIENLLKNGKTRFSVVFNLDNHNQSGSHWVGLYACLNKQKIYFFDSVGKEPKQKIKNFINKIISQFKKKCYDCFHSISTTFSEKKICICDDNKFYQFNTHQHQFENSECGIYSIFFIVRLLNNYTFEEVSNLIIKDRDVNKTRDLLYRFL